MKILKYLGIFIGALLIIFLSIGLFLPEKNSVERSMVINAPVEVIFDQVNNLENWPAWSPWAKLDPNMVVTYSEKKVGEGASYQWSGNEDVMTGELKIVESIENSSIKTFLDFKENGTANGYWKFEKNDEGVNVTWGLSVVAKGYFEKYFGAMLESMMGDVFIKGLTSIKEVSESMPPPAPESKMAIDTIVQDSTQVLDSMPIEE